MEKQLGLFIEGTRSKTDDFLRPKTGCAMIAYKTGATIIPVCITGTGEHKLKIFKKNIVFNRQTDNNESAQYY